MRPPAKPQSARRYPLNAMLGTEANVRLLRVLFATGGEPLGAGELARRAALGRTSIYKALRHLEQAGIVSHVGTGGQRQIRVREEHPLALVLHTLFEGEASAFDRLLDALRQAAAKVPDAVAVWIEGPIATGTDAPDEPVTCVVLGTPDALPRLTVGLRDALAPIERAFDVTVSIHGATRAELAMRSGAGVRALRDAILLAGTPPAAFHPSTRAQAGKRRHVGTHGDLDAQAVALGAALATLIRRDPGLVDRAGRDIERRLRRASPRERRELEEWAQLLSTATPNRLRALLVDPGERMTRLRQSMPFMSVLAADERASLAKLARDATSEE